MKYAIYALLYIGYLIYSANKKTKSKEAKERNNREKQLNETANRLARQSTRSNQAQRNAARQRTSRYVEPYTITAAEDQERIVEGEMLTSSDAKRWKEEERQQDAYAFRENEGMRNDQKTGAKEFEKVYDAGTSEKATPSRKKIDLSKNSLRTFFVMQEVLGKPRALSPRRASFAGGPIARTGQGQSEQSGNQESTE